ncbi:MAG: FAD-binding domain-containing protein [Pseudomonadota bacterium]
MNLAVAPAAAFDPTLEAARARLHAVSPADYARTRNHLEGRVTRLSPYLTHGFLDLAAVVRHLRDRHQLPPQHKLLQELGWRAYFQHVWRHEGERILQSRHPGPLPDEAYSRELPADLREARTGVAAIDLAVRALYRDGYLHNHARLWLASYTVHLRKVHWRAGADWMLGHLLDGDLASNHLSWQWVAGTASHKPYLFNADNVAQFAPAAWGCRGTSVDVPYELLDQRARQPQAWGPEPGEHAGVVEPVRSSHPPAQVFSVPDAAAVAGRDVWLVHPWSLGEVPAGALPVAVCDVDAHASWPWTQARWRFVVSRMQALTPLRWIGSTQALVHAMRTARSVRGWRNGHLPVAWNEVGLAAPPPAFVEPAGFCRSFSAYWSRVRVLHPSPQTEGDVS